MTGRRAKVPGPNLQNISLRTETGRKVRASFLPPVVSTADYTAVELALAAKLAKDKKPDG